MAKNSVRDFDATAANNTDIQSVDIAENCAPSGINNAIRELMADVKDVSTGTIALESPQADSMTVTGDLTVDTNTLFVDSTNNRLGVGTGSPDKNLEVASSGDTTLRITDTRNTSYTIGDSKGAVEFYWEDGSGSFPAVASSINCFTADTFGSAGGLNFKTHNGANLGTRMTLDETGNVGIGTTSPSSFAKLHLASTGTTGLYVDGSQTSDANIFDMVVRNGTDSVTAITSKRTGANDAAALTFSTQATGGSLAERMRIDSSGNVGIGTSSPQGDGIHIVTPDDGTGIVLSGTTATAGTQVLFSALNEATTAWHSLNIGSHQTIFRTSGTERMRLTSGGDLGIGVSSPTGKLHVGGTIVLSASGTDANRASVFYNTSTGQLILVTSDARLKKDFDYDIAGIETVKKLKPLRYSWKDSDKRQLGFLAQESIEADEHLAWNDTENDHWGLDGWDGYAAVLTKAIQEQQVIIEDLKTRIEELENSNG